MEEKKEKAVEDEQSGSRKQPCEERKICGAPTKIQAPHSCYRLSRLKDCLHYGVVLVRTPAASTNCGGHVKCLGQGS